MNPKINSNNAATSIRSTSWYQQNGLVIFGPAHIIAEAGEIATANYG
jgi:hypothetical protein